MSCYCNSFITRAHDNRTFTIKHVTNITRVGGMQSAQDQQLTLNGRAADLERLEQLTLKGILVVMVWPW